MILDHVILDVSDYEAARRFCDAALAPLGIAVMMEYPGAAACGYGRDGHPAFWIQGREEAAKPLHIAFGARSRAEVDAFHAAALAAGARDNGAPGLRPHYHESYYGAFVIGPDGHNLEAVCHLPA